ncbi:hypothetical protein Clacol_008715 [Clathrus columnatus]|uniref:Uncharacterized protein n=1 Tax=Clathrus columnatus TaxID=1419009 RepID=A0AAV5APZ5_9AGAM|nr:hypothetical protein Clacol_008715 [Clathrus columnatus]
MSSEPFKALNVSSAHVNSFNNVAELSKGAPEAPKNPPRLEDISSPHELTAFVESLLSQLEGRFDDMSSQILDKLSQMSTRVDSLETSIQDLINADNNRLFKRINIVDQYRLIVMTDLARPKFDPIYAPQPLIFDMNGVRLCDICDINEADALTLRIKI